MKLRFRRHLDNDEASRSTDPGAGGETPQPLREDDDVLADDNGGFEEEAGC